MANKVIISGRITKDLDLRKTQTGLSVLSFNIAVDRIGKDEKTDFIPVVVWRQSAEFLSQYAHKGTLIFVDGHLQTRIYENGEQKTTVTEIVAERVEILSQPKNKEDIIPHENVPTVEITDEELPF